MLHQRTYSPVLEAWAGQVAAAHHHLKGAAGLSPSSSSINPASVIHDAAAGAPIWELIKVIASSIIEVVLSLESATSSPDAVSSISRPR